MTAEDSWPFTNIVLPPWFVEPRIKGPVTMATMSDPTLHQFLYDAGWEAAKGPAKKLIEDV
jgi:hypothetical protein